jgi:hypothetical protein
VILVTFTRVKPCGDGREGIFGAGSGLGARRFCGTYSSSRRSFTDPGRGL